VHVANTLWHSCSSQINEQYNGNGQGLFEVDGRGIHQRDWILNEEDYLRKFVKNMQTYNRPFVVDLA
jgi:hypothetical protein